MIWENPKYAMSLKSGEEKSFKEKGVLNAWKAANSRQRRLKEAVNVKINTVPVSFEREVSAEWRSPDYGIKEAETRREEINSVANGSDPSFK